MKQTGQWEPDFDFIVGAELAMKKAGAQAVLEHLLTGDPLVVERDGKAAHVAPEEYLHVVLEVYSDGWADRWKRPRIEELRRIHRLHQAAEWADETNPSEPEA
jgi:hypothetical protein